MYSVNKLELSEKLEMILDALSKVNEKFTTVHNIINDASDGLDPRIDDNTENLLTKSISSHTDDQDYEVPHFNRHH